MTPLRRTLATLGIATIAATGSLFASGAPANAAYYYYGAIAYDYSGNTGAAWNYPDSGSALSAAMARCGAHCANFSFYNSCGAVAYTTSGRHYATAPGGYSTLADAESAALNSLPYRGYIAQSVCTAR